VEFANEEQLVWSDTLRETSAKRFNISLDEDTMILTGQLEIADANFISLRIGESVMMIEAVGTPSNIGTFVEARINKLYLYDTRI